MDFFNHYTLNTGDFRQSTREELDEGTCFALRKMVREAEKSGSTEVLDDVKMRITREGTSYIITLFIEVDEQEIPILCTMGCRDRFDYEYVWDSARHIYSSFFKEDLKVVPILPFVADIVYPMSILAPSVLEWSGSFCRDMGWFLLGGDE